MPLGHLLDALEREARAQADALLAAARAEAEAIARASVERQERERAQALHAREADLRGAAEAALGEARRAARTEVLVARQRLVDRVFAAAREMLPATLTGEEYRTALPAHVAEAVAAIGDAPAVIRCRPVIADGVNRALEGRKNLVVETDAAAPPGIVVATTDGAIEVDNSLAGRLERLRPRLALEVLARANSP